MDSRSNNDEPSTSITIDEFLFRSILVRGGNSGGWIIESFIFVTGHVVQLQVEGNRELKTFGRFDGGYEE